jgi:hypothetical protein
MSTIDQDPIRQLSSEEEEIFRRFDQQQRLNSKYVKFQDGEKKVLRFDTTKEPTMSESRVYEGKINWDFSVYDTEVSNYVEKIWSASKETAKKVVALLKIGYTVLEVERIGTGRNTTYRVRPIR